VRSIDRASGWNVSFLDDIMIFGIVVFAADTCFTCELESGTMVIVVNQAKVHLFI
jgi:hypothetical protein